jgi:hypothetical protein
VKRGEDVHAPSSARAPAGIAHGISKEGAFRRQWNFGILSGSCLAFAYVFSVPGIAIEWVGSVLCPPTWVSSG